MLNSIPFLSNLIKKLIHDSNQNVSKKSFIGFDGYIDKIQKVVKTRTKNEVVFYPTLKEFGDRIVLAAGKSGQVEIVTQEIKIGGNAPIMANSMGALGVHNICLGNAGYPTIIPEFENLHKNVKMLSIGAPGESSALEFNDGKMIMSDLTPFTTLNWKHVKKTIGLDTLIENMEKCSVLALVGWCNPEHATDVWKGILKEVMPASDKKDLILFDTADPTKKSKEDLLEVLDVINKFSAYGKVVLGINENETNKLYNILISDIGNGFDEDISLESKGSIIFSKMSIDGLLIHPTDRSIMINNEGVVSLDGHIIQEPKISTGGGDNLNAGFCLGHILGYSLKESMIIAMATSGAYVKNGESPDIPTLVEYLREWK